MPEDAPDFVEAVVGYRAWHIEPDGLLRPWTFTALPWQPGANRAVCAREVRHEPPVADCMCGLYALTDPADRRLDFRGDHAVGAVAAWGGLEVHRTGFRAAAGLPRRPGGRRDPRVGRPRGAPDRLPRRAGVRHGAGAARPRRVRATRGARARRGALRRAARRGRPAQRRAAAPRRAAV